MPNLFATIAFAGLLTWTGNCSEAYGAPQSVNIWIRQAEGLPRAETWERGERGVWSRARVGGAPLLQVGADVWRLELKPQRIPFYSCDCVLAALAAEPELPISPCLRQAYHMVPSAVSARTGERVLVAALPEAVSDEEQAGLLTFQVFGAIGPFVIVASHAVQDGCGAAHGRIDSALHVTDLRTGRAVAAWTNAEEVRITKGLASRALRAVRGQIAVESQLDWPGDATFLRGIRPTWVRGELALEMLMSVGWDYADGDGIWGSGSRSAWVSGVGQRMLQRFANFRRLPEGVGEVLDRVPEAIGVGVMRSPRSQHGNAPGSHYNAMAAGRGPGVLKR